MGLLSLFEVVASSGGAASSQRRAGGVGLVGAVKFCTYGGGGGGGFGMVSHALVHVQRGLHRWV